MERYEAYSAKNPNAHRKSVVGRVAGFVGRILRGARSQELAAQSYRELMADRILGQAGLIPSSETAVRLLRSLPETRVNERDGGVGVSLTALFTPEGRGVEGVGFSTPTLQYVTYTRAGREYPVPVDNIRVTHGAPIDPQSGRVSGAGRTEIIVNDTAAILGEMRDGARGRQAFIPPEVRFVLPRNGENDVLMSTLGQNPEPVGFDAGTLIRQLAAGVEAFQRDAANPGSSQG